MLKRRKWILITAVVTALALLSAAQIYLRQRAAGQSPSGLQAVATNLLAWCPWIVLTAVVLHLGRWIPLVSGHWRRHLAFHLLAATLTAAVYLAYLTLFWFAFFPDFMGRLTPAAYPPAYGRVLGEFFLIAFVGYWLILAVGFGIEAAAQAQAQAPDTEAETLDEPKRQDEPKGQDEPQRLEVRSRGRVRFINVYEIDWIEAEGSYVRLHVGETSILHRRTLSSLVEELGEAFVRIHRGAAVRLERVTELRPISHGEALLRLNTGRDLKVSRSYRRQVEPLLRRSGSLH